MATILQFRRPNSYAPIRIGKGSNHSVTVWIVDARRPKEARWHMQWPIQRAASFKALKGFTDIAAHNQTRHSFYICSSRLLKRFLRDIETLVRNSRVVVIVDGARVRTHVKTAA